jgi:hypothetical protein
MYSLIIEQRFKENIEKEKVLQKLKQNLENYYMPIKKIDIFFFLNDTIYDL